MTAKDTIKQIQGTINEFLGSDVLEKDGDFGSKSKAALEKVIAASKNPAETAPIGNQFDARTEKNLATLDPKAQSIFRPFIKAAKEAAAALGCEYVAIGGSRTWAEQDVLYAQGRTRGGKIVTNAKGGQSWHNFGIALDFGVFEDGKYLDDSAPAKAEKVHKAVGKLAKDFGLEWGGNWTSIVDLPHFQVAAGLTLAQARERFGENGTLFV